GEGADSVVLDAADVTSAVTTSARASVSTARGSLDVLLADAQLGTMLVATAGTADTDRQEALALTAVLARAIPQGSGGLIAALPRDIGTGDLARSEERRVGKGCGKWWTQYMEKKRGDDGKQV